MSVTFSDGPTHRGAPRAARMPASGPFQSQIVNGLEQRHIGAERREVAKEERRSRSRASVSARRARAGGVHAPGPPVLRDRFEMAEPGEHGSRRLRAPARQPRIAVGRVAHERQIVGDREPAATPNFAMTPASSTVGPRPPVQLDDARPAHALREVLVGRADDNAIDARVARRRPRPPAASASSASNSTIGQTTTPSAVKRLFEQRKLREQLRLDAGAGLVARARAGCGTTR